MGAGLAKTSCQSPETVAEDNAGTAQQQTLVPIRQLWCCTTEDALQHQEGGKAPGLVNTQPTLGGSGGILGDLPLQCLEAEVEFDYDDSIRSRVRSRPSKTSSSIRRQLHKAARRDDAPSMLRLVADGADLGDVGEALRLAAFRGSAAVVRELVAVGMAVNEVCPDTGMTSLQLAAGSGHPSVCELLLDAMADPNETTPTALSLARSGGHEEVLELIERHNAAMELLMKGEEPEEGTQPGRGHVLPRVSYALSDAVMQAAEVLPAHLTNGLERVPESEDEQEGPEAVDTNGSAKAGSECSRWSGTAL